MKCCGSPTTFIVPEAGRARDVAAAFNALLFGAAFEPLAKAMGFYGDAVVGIAARSVAHNERGGMTDRLERAIEAAVRPQTAGARSVDVP